MKIEKDILIRPTFINRHFSVALNLLANYVFELVINV